MTDTKENKLKFEKSIVFENVNFFYENEREKVLNDFCLAINKGEKIGIIGESGGGKSTFLKILSGLIFHKSGKFLIDTKTLDSNKIYKLRNIIGYVKQDFYLLDCTLAENIAFGNNLSDIDYEKLHKTIEMAQLTSVVEKLKFGVKTNIGEFGNNLSGGQRQRIAIARALYNDAEILIFDEATSALDDNTESDIINTINQLSNKLTIVMVAHRKSSLKFCDKIYEINNGTINEI